MATAYAVLDESREIQHVIDRLETEFFGQLPDDVIAQTVRECAERWSDAPIKVFVPLLVERCAVEALRARGAVLSDERGR